MDMIIIKKDSNEWNHMWEWVAAHPLNEGLDNTSLAMNDGEGWQYMGSFRQEDRVIHEFRHRNHPRTQQREFIKLLTTNIVVADDIDKVLAVK
jgi:hypothetical protein